MNDFELMSLSSSSCGMRAGMGITQVPVGIMMSTMGGTAIESWMSAQLLYGNTANSTKDPTSNTSACPANPADPTTAIPANSFSPPTSNFNGQILPLTRYTIAGVLWYQGESNEVIGANATYSCRFKAMMDDWSHRFNQGQHLPFGYVQIGTDCGPSAHTFALRIGQCNNNVGWERTFFAAALDVPNTLQSQAPAGGVHLMDKRTIGARLALGARATVYGDTVAHTGPAFTHAVVLPPPPPGTAITPQNGTRVVLHFTVPGSGGSGGPGGLEVRDRDGFELNSNCGWGGSFVPAAVVEWNVSSVMVEARSIINAVGVRQVEVYGACCSL